LVLTGVIVLGGGVSAYIGGVAARSDGHLRRLEAQLQDITNAVADIQHQLAGIVEQTQPSAATQQTSVPTVGRDAQLARILVTDVKAEKETLVKERLTSSREHKSISIENIHTVVGNLNAMNAILMYPEHLSMELLYEAEGERDRLAGLLCRDVPKLVRKLDAEALKAHGKVALAKWAEAGAVLGYYPSSDVPEEAGKIQLMVSAHQKVRARLATIQYADYNLWVCEQIGKAREDFAIDTTREGRLKGAIQFLGPIDCNYLDLATTQLYQAYLDDLKKANVDIDHLAKALQNAKKMLPGDDGAKPE